MFTSYVVWAANPALLALLLLRGYWEGMLSRYRIFYGYIVFVLVTSLVRIGVSGLYGRASYEYYYAYYLPTFVMPFLQLAIIWSVYARIFGLRGQATKLIKPLVVVFALSLPLVARIVFFQGGDLFFHFHLITLFLQVVSCLLVCRKMLLVRDRIRIGQNLAGMLLGIGLMVALQTLNFAAYVLLGSSAEVFWFFVPFVYVLSLAVMVYCLWNYQPVRQVQPEFGGELIEVGKGSP